MALSLNKKQKLSIVGAGVVAIAALSGGTLAQWNSSADVDGKGITAGNLQVALVNSEARDVSSDLPNHEAHTINTDTWRAVPGDVVELTSNLDVALEGDNLVAQLDTSQLDNVITDEAKDYVTVDIKLVNSDGTIITANDDGKYLLQANSTGQDAGVDATGIKVVGSTLDNTTDVKAVATITFDANTPNRVLTETKLADLTGSGVTLEQVRTY